MIGLEYLIHYDTVVYGQVTKFAKYVCEDLPVNDFLYH